VKRIGVLTSGGDGPGLNPCIRAVVRMAVDHDMKVTGIKRGFSGLIDHEVVSLDSRAVGSGMISQGGTRLGTSRSLEFKTIRLDAWCKGSSRRGGKGRWNPWEH